MPPRIAGIPPTISELRKGGPIPSDLARMLGEAREVQAQPGAAGKIAFEIHTQWTVHVIDAAMLGPMFQFATPDEAAPKFIAWDVPGGQRFLFIANEDLLRAVIGELTKALAPPEAPADDAG